MPEDSVIRGGYYIKARQIEYSKIAHAAPHVREIWDWLIRSAQHKPFKASNKVIDRGQILTSYEEIADDLHWMVGFIKKVYKKYQIDCALRWIRQEGMITTQKTTRGLIITVCNYDTYQDPSNYDYDTASNTITTRRTATINKNDNNDKKESINRGAGDLASPTPPPDGFHYLPDGRSFIEPIVFYTKSDFNGLPEAKNSEIRRFLKVTKDVERMPEEISELWESFKEMELTFQKPYRNQDDVYRHFLNWTKKQTFKKGQTTRKPTATKKQGKITGVEFINDFTQCKMSDDSVVDLNQNQRDSAKHNMINPSSIVKN